MAKFIIDGKEIDIGGSSEELRFIATIVLDESTYSYYIDKDESGNSFSLTELILYSPSFTSGSNYVGVEMNSTTNTTNSFKSWYGTTAKMLFAKYTVLGTDIAESFPIGNEALKQRDFKTNCLYGKNKIESFLFFMTVAPITGEKIYVYGR